MKLLYHMFIFAHVVEKGSFTAAAEALNHTKSVVSRHVSQLERQLGVKLLNRTTRRLWLTEAGALFHRRCTELVSLVELAGEEVQDLAAKPQGALTITAPHALSDSLAVPALQAFVREHTGIQPTLLSEDARLDLVERQIDLAISVGGLRDSSYRAVRIGSLQDLLCAAPGYLARRGTPRRPAELHGLAYIANSWEGAPVLLRLRAADQRRPDAELRLQPMVRANTLPAVLAFLRAGMGVGLVPTLAIKDDLAAGRLVPLLPDYGTPANPIYAVHAYDRQPPLKVRAFIETLRSHLNAGGEDPAAV